MAGLARRRLPSLLTLDHIGPMTPHRRPTTRLMLEVIAGYDPHDPGSAAVPNGH